LNVLILGGAGFLGSNLARRCVGDSGNHVLVVESLDEDIHLARWAPRFTFEQGLTKTKEIRLGVNQR